MLRLTHGTVVVATADNDDPKAVSEWLLDRALALRGDGVPVHLATNPPEDLGYRLVAVSTTTEPAQND